MEEPAEGRAPARREDDDHDLLTYNEAQARLLREAAAEDARAADLEAVGGAASQVEAARRRASSLRQASQSYRESEAHDENARGFLTYQAAANKSGR